MPACLQPLDALGTVLEGGLLGASDTNWIATRAFCGCALSLAALAAVAVSHQGGLLLIWLAMRLLNLVALGLDLGRYLGPALGGPWQGLLTGAAPDVKRKKG